MVVNSQQMHMSFSSCRRVAASNLKVLAPATSPNTDGIHISRSHGVEVMDSTVRTGLSLQLTPETSLFHKSIKATNHAATPWIAHIFHFMQKY